MVAPPTNVAVTGDDKAATITWAGVANAVSYKVLRSTDLNVQGQDLTGPITAATFVDSKLTPGTTLYYSVVATAANGSTAASAPVAYLVPATMLAINKTAARRTVGVPAPQPPPAPPPAAPVIPAGTSVVPSAALPGQAVRVLGTGFSALTAVKSGTTSLTWTPVSDTEISLTLPGPVSGLYGRQSLPVALHHNAPNVAPGSVQPAPVRVQ